MAQKTHCCAASLPILQCAESSEVPSGLVYKHRGGSVDRRLCLQLRASILSGAFWRPRGPAGADAGETCWAAGCLFSPFEGLDVVWNALLAPFILKEKLTRPVDAIVCLQ